MKKLSRIRTILYVLGLILIFLGLVMLNVINGVNLFEHTNKVLSFSVLILGIIFCIISRFFRKSKKSLDK
ncbi:hypothetical protein COM24_03465 [Bacillus toyonensis]|nr:hypothetical protein [Bacillus toyonensis]PEE26479.1 hypothetical protein CON98_30155 [Bacillus toyonensis]PGC59029.1 hypothetical protein COM24_03465 [Bacillus toyonensis]PHG27933.1 hypothetical protein COI60_29885 [Bacillus toyonensis]